MVRTAAAAAVALLVVVELPTLVAQQAPSLGNRTDGELLQAFKATFANGEQVLSSWVGLQPCNYSGSTNSSWEGIRCDSFQGTPTASVTVLQLPNKGLVGTIPPAGFLLPNTLAILTLERNEIHGPLPPGHWLPPSLVAMNIQFNPIGGTIPPGLMLPARLKSLYLNGLNLTGSIPSTWKLQNLNQLSLNKNKLQGRIPWDDWQNATLQSLWLNDNLLTGTLPAILPNRLLFLNLTSNKLSGKIPPGWSLPAGMQTLLLADNQLEGGLPDLLLPEVFQRLDIWANQLAGTLPAWPDQSKATHIVAAVPSNSFCGEVPPSPLYVDGETGARVESLPNCTAAVVSGGPTVAAIIGGTVGGVAFVVLAVFLWWWCMGRKRHRLEHQTDLEMLASTSTRRERPASTSTRGADTKSNKSARKDWSKHGLQLDDPLLAEITSRLRKGVSQGRQQLQQHDSADSALPPFPSGGTSTDGSNSRSRKEIPPRELGVKIDKYIIPFLKLQFVKQIGRGSFSRVYLCKWQETHVSAKLLLGAASASASVSEAAEMLLSESGLVQSNLQREAALHAALRHPCVLGFIGLTVFPPCLIIEYCPRGSLHKVLMEAREGGGAVAEKLNWAMRLRLGLGAARGMLYLHTFSPPVVHRDLKSPNLLITADWQVKVGDMNVSKVMGESSVDASTSAVTNPSWLAPEVLRGESHTFASDVFAFGLILYELLTWTQPWAHAKSPWQISAAVIAGARPEIPPAEKLPGAGADFSGLDAYLALIHKCWAQGPADRPGFAEIIAELRALQQLAGRAESRGGSADAMAASPPVREAKAAPKMAVDASQGTGPSPGSSSRRPTSEEEQRPARAEWRHLLGAPLPSPFQPLAQDQ